MRDWLHVDDHVAALLAVLERGTVGGTYNIASGSEIRNIELAHRVCDALAAAAPTAGRGYRDLIELVEDRPGHDRRYCIDSSRIRGELGWRPLTTLDDGLKRTVGWYVRNQEWCRAAANRAARHRDG
jgi:dTDP-glucose 4,6-dehydratase